MVWPMVMENVLMNVQEHNMVMMIIFSVQLVLIIVMNVKMEILV